MGAENENVYKLIHWCFPLPGKIKINSDARWSQPTGYASYEGLTRNDHQGRWIEGFCGCTGASSVLAAELHDFRQALRLAKDKQWELVEIGSDSLVDVNLINKEDDIENHPYRTYIADCRKLKNEANAIIYHILRETNRCTDKMARQWWSQTEQHVRVLIPPDEVVEDLMADMVGVAFPKSF